MKIFILCLLLQISRKGTAVKAIFIRRVAFSCEGASLMHGRKQAVTTMWCSLYASKILSNG